MAISKSHLSAYLAHNLQGVWQIQPGMNDYVCSLVAITENEPLGIWKPNTSDDRHVPRSDCKPLFRQMKELNNEITIDGETFTPIEVLEKLSNEIDFDLKHELFFNEETNEFITEPCEMEGSGIQLSFSNPMETPYFIIEKLCQWHFDVFGYIQTGDAIAIESSNGTKEQTNVTC